MRALVTFALPSEFDSWRRRAGFSRMAALPGAGDTVRFPLFLTGSPENDIVVALTGIGPLLAGRATRYALQCAPDLCISSGLAGALKDSYEPGALLAAEEVADVRYESVFSCAPGLLKTAAACGARVVARFLTSPVAVVSAAAKRALSERGDVVEMESAAVLAAAREANIPAIAIRSISDGVGEDLPLDLDRLVKPDGRVRHVRLLGSLAKKPSAVPGLLKLAGSTRRATAVLASFLDRYIAALVADGQAQGIPAGAVATERS